MFSQQSPPSIPSPIDYGSVIDNKSPNSPNFAPNTPSIHPENYTPELYNHNLPSYSPCVSPRSRPISPPHSPPHSPRNDRHITITDAVHIPRWATSFVLGGRTNKHLGNILRRNGDLITHVGEPTRFAQPNGQIFTIVTLIGYGYSSDVYKAMKYVKRDIFGTIKKAKQLKTDGNWREAERRPRNNRRDDRYRDDRYRDDRYRDDRCRDDRRRDRY
jgi:hypothetical protein